MLEHVGAALIVGYAASIICRREIWKENSDDNINPFIPFPVQISVS